MNEEERYDTKRAYINRLYLNLYQETRNSLNDIEIENIELSYIAGLFDTEVALQIEHSGHSYSLAISYTKIDYDILKYLSNIFGGKIGIVKPQPYHRYTVWCWRVSAKDAYKTLRTLHPFLRIKKEAAEICIEFYENYWRTYIEKPISKERQVIGVKYKTRLQNYQRKPGSSKKPNIFKEIRKQRDNSLAVEYAKEPKIFKHHQLPNIELPKTELAYIAGLLDVESAFLISKLHNRNIYLLEIKYIKDDHITLDYLASIFGGKVRPSSRSKLSIVSPWLWLLVSSEAYRLLSYIYPFLHIKQEAAKICMEFFENYWTGTRGVPVSPERQAIGKKYKALLRQYQPKSLPHRRW